MKKVSAWHIQRQRHLILVLSLSNRLTW